LRFQDLNPCSNDQSLRKPASPVEVSVLQVSPDRPRERETSWNHGRLAPFQRIEGGKIRKLRLFQRKENRSCVVRQRLSSMPGVDAGRDAQKGPARRLEGGPVADWPWQSGTSPLSFGCFNFLLVLELSKSFPAGVVWCGVLWCDCGSADEPPRVKVERTCLLTVPES
jgi:hypothetical protein